MTRISTIIFLLSFILLAESNWTYLDDGLQFSYFKSSLKSIAGDSRILIFKIDPDKYDLRLLSAKEEKCDALTAPEWANKHNLMLVFNAGMFTEDYKTNVGYMKNYAVINNKHINEYRSAAAFNPKDSSIDRFKIFDLEQITIDSINNLYNTVIQNLRLIKRPGINVWSKQIKKWSECALGQDEDGNMLVAFSRSPYSMSEFNDILLNLPIKLKCAQHLEGGPEASLFLNYKNIKMKLMGSYETAFYELDENQTFYQLPNVIGIVKRNSP